ncbi:MAG: anti-sigma factor family protein, partial [Planctomycetota bacterium]
MDACEEIRKKLLNHHLGILSEEERKALDGHLASCQGCLAAFDELGADFAAFRTWGDADPPADILKNVLHEASLTAAKRAQTGDNPKAAPNPSPPPTSNPHGKTEGSEISELLGDHSIASMEKDLQELEKLVSSKNMVGSGTEVDLASADIYTAPRKAPGKLTKDQRERLLQELGLDEDSPVPGMEGDEEEGAPALEDLAKIADQAAKRKSRRNVPQADDWEKLCGTT